MLNCYKWFDPPIGRLKLVACDTGLAAIAWENDRRVWKHFERSDERAL